MPFPFRRRAARFIVAACSTALSASTALAQTTQPDSPLAAVHRLRTTGDLAGAVRLLRDRLVTSPDDGEAARLLAETLYWLKDVAAARAEYERALVRHPEDTDVRLQFGRMLVETGDATRARELLAPLVDAPEGDASAHTLLGTLAYWRGDLGTARRHFEAALRADPAREDARRPLREIAALTAPWVRVSAELARDDQPLARGGGRVEAGWFATPLLSVAARAEPVRYRVGDSLSRVVTTAELVLAHYAPAPRLETELAAGTVRRDDGGAGDWTARGSLGIRLPAHVTLRVQGARAPYLNTQASFDTPVMIDELRARMEWTHPRGWLGQAAVQYRRFPDDNAIRTAYAWVLAPVVRRAAVELQAGYGFSAEDAEESRFVLAASPGGIGSPNQSLAGRYAPYYTPERFTAHAVLGALALRPSSGTVVRLGGSYAVWATDDAPFFYRAATPPQPNLVQRGSYQRESHPRTARASIERSMGDGLTLAATGEYLHTVYYASATAGIHLTYRFTGIAVRGIERR